MLAFAVAPAGAQAAETGVVPDLSWGISNSAQDQTGAALQDVGAGWVRMSMSWSNWVEPSDNSYGGSALSHFDRAVNIAEAAGYKIIIMVEESPSWARDTSNKNAPPRDNAELAEFMGFLANRYRGRVEAYQVWNEPNLKWAWDNAPNAAEYAQMLRTVAPSIRAADPGAKVLFAGVSRNDYRFLEDAYASMPDIGDYFDVMATHPYVYNGGSPEGVWLDENGRINKGAFSAYREVRATMEYYGDTKPIWFTEFGWSTTTAGTGWNLGVTPEMQATYLAQAYDCMLQDSYIEVATWYNFRNEYWANDSNTWVTQLGLMSTNFTRKPAYYALKNYVPGQVGCTYQDPAPPAGEPAPEPTPGPTPEPAPTDPVANPSTDPEPEADPADGQDEGDAPVTSSTTRSSAMLAVSRARIRNGRLAIAGRLARGTTGKVRGFANYGRGTRRFQAHIDDSGKIRVDKRLRGAGDVSSARVTLVYAGNRRYQAQRVTLKAARHSARLRVRKVVADASASQAATVSGTLAPRARGSVMLRLSYRTADGELRTKAARSKIRNGAFNRSLRLPSGARRSVLRVIFAGDPQRGIGGASATLNLR